MYKYLDTKGQILPLAEDGADLWINGIKKILGRFGVLIGAFANNELIGFVHGTIKFSPEYLGTLKLGFLTHQFILESERGKGVGENLFRELENLFIMQDVHSIEIQSNFLNEGAKAFYKKMGYETELVQFRKVLK